VNAAVSAGVVPRSWSKESGCRTPGRPEQRLVQARARGPLMEQQQGLACVTWAGKASPGLPRPPLILRQRHTYLPLDAGFRLSDPLGL
jgi:hypothetical protein